MNPSDTPPQPAAIAEHDWADGPLTLAEITDHDRPLVLRGLVRDWPIVGKARASDTAFAKYLAALDSGAPVDIRVVAPEAEGVIGYNDDLTDFNFEHFQVSLTQGLKRLALYSREHSEAGLAIQSALMARCLPAFADTHRLALLDPSVEPRIWIGNRVTTPAHFDTVSNLACVVCGGRRFTLFPPDQLPNLYIGPTDFSPAGAAISCARMDRPDTRRFPLLRRALDAAQVAELRPGDAVYIPPMWWHNVASLHQLNALVNYWWSDVDVPGYAHADTIGAFYHCLLAFRWLAPTQRQAWRDMLDHYVFSEADPLAHMPASRHGVWHDPPTQEQMQTLRAMATTVHTGDAS